MLRVVSYLSFVAYSLLLDRDIAYSNQVLLVLTHLDLILIIVIVMELRRYRRCSLLTSSAIYSTVDSLNIVLVVAAAQGT